MVEFDQMTINVGVSFYRLISWKETMTLSGCFSNNFELTSDPVVRAESERYSI